MRPSGEMAQASVNTKAAPPTAREPRWTRCQSLAKPSVLEYWHIGETTMRLRSFTSRICNSSNRFIGNPLFEFPRLRIGAVASGSIVAAMRFQVLMIGDGFEEADDVLACRGIEAVHQYGISGVVFTDEFEFGIVQNDVAVIFDAN